MMQNHYVISSKYNISGPETCEIGPKLWLWTCPDLPRPVQEDKYLLQTNGNAFIFSDFIKSLVLLSTFIIFYKIIGFTKRVYHFYKIIGFIQQIYYFYKIICFTKQIYFFIKSYVLLIKFISFYKIMYSYSQIY